MLTDKFRAALNAVSKGFHTARWCQLPSVSALRSIHIYASGTSMLLEQFCQSTFLAAFFTITFFSG